jgi:hypothetical protein
MQTVGYDFVRATGSYSTEDLDFTRRESICAHMFSYPRGDLMGYSPLPKVHPSNGVDEICTEHSFDDVAHGPGLQRSCCLDVTRVRCQDYDSSIRKLAADGEHGIDTIHLWHLQIHQRYVWSELSKCLNCFPAIRCLGDEFHVALSLQGECNAVPDERVIINTKDSDTR